LKTILIRTLSGAIYITLVLGSLFLSIWAFAIIALLLNLIALNEFQSFSKYRSQGLITILLGTLIFAYSHFHSFAGQINSNWIWILALVPLIIPITVLFSKDSKNPIYDIGFSFLSIVYITVPLVLLNLLSVNSGLNTPWVIISMFIIIWTNDTFAYLSGLVFGKHKLFVRISPKKTWEGFIGGVLFALVAGYFLHLLIDNISLVEWLILTLLIAVSSVFGDFIESLLKRSASLKDSGKIMPGHGGILDRIDSTLFVAPVVFVYLQIIA